MDEETVVLECPNKGCDKTFTDQKRYEYHLTSCSFGRPSSTQFRVNTSSPTSLPTDKPKAEPKAEPTKAAAKKVTPITTATNSNDVLREQRKQEWGEWIFNDGNPMLFSVAKQFVGIPDGWEDNPQVAQFQMPDGKVMTFWNPTLKQRLTFSEGDSYKLADAFARFSISPMGQAIYLWINANGALIAMGMAAYVAAKYGWKLMQTKAEIAQIQEALKQQMELAKAAEGMNIEATVAEAMRANGITPEETAA